MATAKPMAHTAMEIIIVHTFLNSCGRVLRDEEITNPKLYVK